MISVDRKHMIKVLQGKGCIYVRGCSNPTVVEYRAAVTKVNPDHRVYFGVLQQQNNTGKLFIL